MSVALSAGPNVAARGRALSPRVDRKIQAAIDLSPTRHTQPAKLFNAAKIVCSRAKDLIGRSHDLLQELGDARLQKRARSPSGREYGRTPAPLEKAVILQRISQFLAMATEHCLDAREVVQHLSHLARSESLQQDADAKTYPDRLQRRVNSLEETLAEIRAAVETWRTILASAEKGSGVSSRATSPRTSRASSPKATSMAIAMGGGAMGAIGGLGGRPTGPMGGVYGAVSERHSQAGAASVAQGQGAAGYVDRIPPLSPAATAANSEGFMGSAYSRRTTATFTSPPGPDEADRTRLTLEHTSTPAEAGKGTGAGAASSMADTAASLDVSAVSIAYPPGYATVKAGAGVPVPSPAAQSGASTARDALLRVSPIPAPLSSGDPALDDAPTAAASGPSSSPSQRSVRPHAVLQKAAHVAQPQSMLPPPVPGERAGRADVPAPSSSSVPALPLPASIRQVYNDAASVVPSVASSVVGGGGGGGRGGGGGAGYASANGDAVSLTSQGTRQSLVQQAVIDDAVARAKKETYRIAEMRQQKALEEQARKLSAEMGLDHSREREAIESKYRKEREAELKRLREQGEQAVEEAVLAREAELRQKHTSQVDALVAQVQRLQAELQRARLDAASATADLHRAKAEASTKVAAEVAARAAAERRLLEAQAATASVRAELMGNHAPSGTAVGDLQQGLGSTRAKNTVLAQENAELRSVLQAHGISNDARTVQKAQRVVMQQAQAHATAQAAQGGGGGGQSADSAGASDVSGYETAGDGEESEHAVNAHPVALSRTESVESSSDYLVQPGPDQAHEGISPQRRDSFKESAGVGSRNAATQAYKQAGALDPSLKPVQRPPSLPARQR